MASLILFAVAVGTRLPWASRALVNWDSVQFALATRQFDLAHHQPHPPGYILYVGWGAALNRVTGDPNTSLVVTSILAGGAAVLILHRLALRLLPGAEAFLAAGLFTASPLLWYYSDVALSYAPEAFLALLTVHACVRAADRPGRRRLVLAALALATAGGVRQSTLVLLLPLWTYVAARCGRTAAAWGAMALALAMALWAVPLMWLGGGPARYVTQTWALYALVGQQSSLFRAGPLATAANFASLAGAALVGLNVAAAAAVPYLLGRRPWPAPLRAWPRWFWTCLLLWVAPAVLVFSLGHLGQHGYVLLFLPALYLVIAPCLAALLREGTRLPRTGAAFALRLVSALLLALGVGVAALHLTPAAADAIFPAYAPQFDLEENDTYWRRVTALGTVYSPLETVVLTNVTPHGSFRHAGYYLPQHRVFAVGIDQSGRLGHLFTAYAGRSDYGLEGMARSRRRLPLPDGTRYALVLDPDVSRLPALKQRAATLQVTRRRSVEVIDLSGIGALLFEGGGGRSTPARVLTQ